MSKKVPTPHINAVEGEIAETILLLAGSFKSKVYSGKILNRRKTV